MIVCECDTLNDRILLKSGEILSIFLVQMYLQMYAY